MKFRHYCGSLEESMKCVHEVDSLDDVNRLHPESAYLNKKAVSSHWYCYDERINWDTWIVVDEDGYYLGFSNGELK